MDGLTEMAPKDAIFLYNMVPSEYGTRVRTGYAEWATGVGSAVRTILPFTGAVTGDDKLWVAADDGLYDITSGGASPAVDTAFGTIDSTSGQGVFTNFVNDAGAYFMLYTDESNGYYTYTRATDTWLKVAMGGGGTDISGVNPATFCFVTIFKNRVWFVEKDTGNAWYLAAGSIYGAATKFNFGNKFKHGGQLVALYSWTVDGGEGVDDYLVAISSGGDVIVYKGSDPATATDWFQHGLWYIGPPPAGRRIAGSFSGELYLLSAYGLLPMTKLLSGTLTQQNEVYLSSKITPIINSTMNVSRTQLGWEVRLIPSENLIVITTPKQVGYPWFQFAYSLNTPGWGIYRDMPYYTGDTWQAQFYFADDEGNVYLHSDNVDGTDLAGLNGVAIEWSVLMSFQGHGNDVNYKRIQFIRPIFLAEEAPMYAVEARYDYNLSEALAPPFSASLIVGALWDAALWDAGLWSGEFTEVESVVGGTGMGRVLSVGLNGNSAGKTILVKFDIMADTGGLL